MEVKLLRYSDPTREHLAKAAAVYLGKQDSDNIRRPLSIMKKRHALAIFRGEHARFEFKTSKVVYDHLITYTTADMRACAGLRANEATVFVPPVGDVDPIYTEIGERHLQDYQSLVRGIDPQTEDPVKKKKLQDARTVVPTSVELHYIFQFNFGTLIEALFPQRIWVPGAQPDTKEVAQVMFDLVYEQDPELWDTVLECYGPEMHAWVNARAKLKKKNPELYLQILREFGVIKTMWD